jgi:UDP-glucuronate decarboxylase
MEHPVETGPVNLGNPAEMTVLELAREVLRLTGGKSRVVFRPLPKDDPKQRKPVIDRARSVLGFAPQVSLRDGLAATVESFRDRLARADMAPRSRVRPTTAVAPAVTAVDGGGRRR